MKIPNKKFEIFCGTGGVGKTTLATSRAIFHALSGKKTLLITVDPSHRLKDLLNLSESSQGTPEEVPLHTWNAFSNYETSSLKALLISPPAILKRISKEGHERTFKNRILTILARPYGGMNEILGLLEVQYQMEQYDYDIVVLDTPPGKHFIDFLTACKKIQAFFDNHFISFFQYLTKLSPLSGSKQNTEKSSPFLERLLGSGMKKLFYYLEKVTGKVFLEEFSEAVSLIYAGKNSFLKGLELQNKIAEKKNSNWFLISSAEQDKLFPAKELHQKTQEFAHSDQFFILNKSLQQLWKRWIKEGNKTCIQNPILTKIMDTNIKREQKLVDSFQNEFNNFYQFPEIFSNSTEKQLLHLVGLWKELS